MFKFLRIMIKKMEIQIYNHVFVYIHSSCTNILFILYEKINDFRF
jgi:hypothetical protein